MLLDDFLDNQSNNHETLASFDIDPLVSGFGCKKKTRVLSPFVHLLGCPKGYK